VGGLGIKNVRKFNVALLAKWLWRLGLEEVGVWRDIIESRYDSWREMSVTTGERKASTWCQDLDKICDTPNHCNWFQSRIKWELGDGNKIKFWEDK